MVISVYPHISTFSPHEAVVIMPRACLLQKYAFERNGGLQLPSVKRLIFALKRLPAKSLRKMPKYGSMLTAQEEGLRPCILLFIGKNTSEPNIKFHVSKIPKPQIAESPQPPILHPLLLWATHFTFLVQPSPAQPSPCHAGSDGDHNSGAELECDPLGEAANKLSSEL